MTAECNRCAMRGMNALAFTATGRFMTRQGLNPFVVAELVCAKCGNVWHSGLPDAVALGQAAREAKGEAAYTMGEVDPLRPEAVAAAVNVPAPSLFPGIAKQSQGFVRIGKFAAGRSVEDVLATIAKRDAKQRQSGDDE